jgi:predicted nucleic acid-binding protein
MATDDLWIAASAMEHGTELMILDRDFTHVPQIMVALYESTENSGSCRVQLDR